MNEFKPISPNPYIVGNPIKTEKMFYGRQDDFDFVHKKFASKINQIVVLCGQRRSGKTSILFQVLNGRLGPDFIPLLIDMQSMAGIRSNADFHTRIYKEINASLKDIELDPPSSNSENDEHEWVDYFRRLLDTVSEKTGGKSILLLFDEYEIIEQMIDTGDITPSVVMLLATLIEGKNKVGLIFTGSMHLEERRKPYWNHLLSKAIARKISFLTESDTRRLCTEPVAGKVNFREDALTVICRLTAGHPFYTQVICQNLVDLINEKRENTVTTGIIQEIVDEIVENPLPQMIYYWDSMSDSKKVVLSLMAVTLPDDKESLLPENVYDSVSEQKYDISISLSSVKETCEQLFQDDLFGKLGQDRYNFRVDIFRHWIKREHSAWQVIQEVGAGFRKRNFRSVLKYISAVVMVILVIAIFFIYQQSSNRDMEIGTGLPDLYTAMIITNVKGIQILLDDGSRAIYQQKTIRLDSLSQGSHHAVVYPPDSTWEPDSHSLDMLIIKDMQDYRVDFSKRVEISVAEDVPPEKTETEAKLIQPPKGTMSVVSVPGGAEIFVNEEFVGNTPLILQPLTPGDHRVLLKKDGYSDVEKIIEIVADSSFLMNEKLQVLQGQLSIVVTGTWVEIEINGISYGRTPRRDPITLRTGDAEVKLLNPAYKPYVKTIKIVPEETYKLAVDKSIFVPY